MMKYEVTRFTIFIYHQQPYLNQREIKITPFEEVIFVLARSNPSVATMT